MLCTLWKTYIYICFFAHKGTKICKEVEDCSWVSTLPPAQLLSHWATFLPIIGNWGTDSTSATKMYLLRHTIKPVLGLITKGYREVYFYLYRLLKPRDLTLGVQLWHWRYCIILFEPNSESAYTHRLYSTSCLDWLLLSILWFRGTAFKTPLPLCNQKFSIF